MPNSTKNIKIWLLPAIVLIVIGLMVYIRSSVEEKPPHVVDKPDSADEGPVQAIPQVPKPPPEPVGEAGPPVSIVKEPRDVQGSLEEALEILKELYEGGDLEAGWKLCA